MPYKKHTTVFKRVKQNKVRAARNQAVRTRVRNTTKAFHATCADKNATAEQRKEALTAAIRTLSKAASKGVIPKARASRKIGRLTLAFNRAQA